MSVKQSSQAWNNLASYSKYHQLFYVYPIPPINPNPGTLQKLHKGVTRA